MIIVKCGDCGEKIFEGSQEEYYKKGMNKLECPSCGSDKKEIILKVEEDYKIHDKIKGKVYEKGKRKGKKKESIEFIEGNEFIRKTEEWGYKRRVIDRKNDKYIEKVWDENKVPIHECDKRLSEHKGHGSAKIKKKK